MTLKTKSNTAYYFCQGFGVLLLVLSTYLTLIFSPEMQATDFVAYRDRYLLKVFFAALCFFWLTDQFIRQYILQNPSIKLKTYLFILIKCAILASCGDNLLGWLLSAPEPDTYINQSGIILEIFYYLFINSLFFGAWVILYLTITSIRDKSKLAEQIKEQQLASLMNQINPHFLFNSLNTIRGMIYEDEDKAAELVTQLSTLFRYNLSTDTKAITTLGKELEVCRQYLAIEDIRLGRRLTVNIDVPIESLEVKIPTMGLLTIVENAIKHGIATLKDGGTLTIQSEIIGENLSIDVMNPYQNHLVKSGTKVGLKNLKQRIELIFGAHGTLKQKTDNDIFHVNMNLPYEFVKNG